MNPKPCPRLGRFHSKAAGLGLAALAALLCARGAAGEFPAFRCHEIGKCGDKMGQTSLVDVDRDGDLDWVVGCRGGEVWWFEFKAPDEWVRHKIGGKAETDVGGTTFDVNGDGWVDQVSGAVWYRNPGEPRTKEFTRHPNGAISTHDNVAADMDGDGKLDIVAMSDKAGLFWYKIPPDPTGKWLAHKIGSGVHGGVAPRGVGDLDGDGDNDIVRSNAWFENKDGKGTAWVEHKAFDFGNPRGPYPFTTKAWVLDLDGDGDRDVVMAEADCERSRVAWFENADGRGGVWKMHLIAQTDQDLHSLAVADFDGDGAPDVFSGGGPLTKTMHKWFIWENADGKGGSWKEHVVLEGKRCHEAVAADIDGDGDVDICSKPWNGNLHVFLENLARTKAGK